MRGGEVKMIEMHNIYLSFSSGASSNSSNPPNKEKRDILLENLYSTILKTVASKQPEQQG